MDKLYYSIQRYKFESNSQLACGWFVVVRCCITRYKDTNLKAIHNTFVNVLEFEKVVLLDTKIQI